MADGQSWVQQELEKQRLRGAQVRLEAHRKAAKMASKAIEGFEERGMELYRGYSARLKGIQDNQMLSQQGKQEQLRAAEADYRSKVEAPAA